MMSDVGAVASLCAGALLMTPITLLLFEQPQVSARDTYEVMDVH